MKQTIKTLSNILTFAVRNRSSKILWTKLKLRVVEIGRSEASGAREWAASRSEDTHSFMSSLDAQLQNETQLISQKIVSESVSTVQELARRGIDLGGGGSIDLIYFLCRLLKPDFVLETGVAAGWSSYAILEALSKNGNGNLDSSDLPYFRIEDPEAYIGILVPDRLRSLKNWKLQTDGDFENLKMFLNGKKRYSIIHYDSDKRKVSRLDFLKRIESWLSDDAVLIMDDIQDNYAFKDYVLHKKSKFKIFEYEGKYVGVIFRGNPITQR